jgi:hypothetical protein
MKGTSKKCHDPGLSGKADGAQKPERMQYVKISSTTQSSNRGAQ